jgi:hypothetical protein
LATKKTSEKLEKCCKGKIPLFNLVVLDVLYHEERLLRVQLRLLLLRQMRPYLLLPFDKKQ